MAHETVIGVKRVTYCTEATYYGLLIWCLKTVSQLIFSEIIATFGWLLGDTFERNLGIFQQNVYNGQLGPPGRSPSGAPYGGLGGRTHRAKCF